MKTECLRVDPVAPDPRAITYAARVLERGGLVVFPTETVYGLGARGLDAAAVARIFAAKGRPAHNPLILHVPDVAWARRLARPFPPLAEALARRFWPGPLTLVVPRAAHIPTNVTAGGPTVALRVPAHAVALALLQTVAEPLAAPSANRSNALSPTCAEHVLEGLDGRVDLVLDAGPCAVGIESTVVDATGESPQVLRPGMLTARELQAVAFGFETKPWSADAESPTCETPPGALRSPGTDAVHYAPRNPLFVIERAALPGQRAAYEARGIVVRVASCGDGEGAWVLPREPEVYARELYATLHRMDRDFQGVLLLEKPPEGERWSGIHDRLRRAAMVSEC